MRWPTMVALSAVVVGVGGCDKIPFLNKNKAATQDSSAMVAAAPKPDTTRPAPTPQPPPQPAPRPAPRREAPSISLTDTPWTPVDTGTVAPGMTQDQVVAIWGAPVAERAFGDRSYLYFRNGCEVTCGTFDVVFLENGQVVDAIVRGPGHNYSGVSSSPPGRKAQATTPGESPGPLGVGG